MNKYSCKLNVPVGSKVAYQSTYGWQDFNLIAESEDLSSVEQLGAECASVWPAHIYDTNGRLVRKNAYSVDGLDDGVYIVKGRKVTIK